MILVKTIDIDLFCWQIEEQYLLTKPFQLKQLLLLGGLLLVALCLVLHLEEEDKRKEKLPGCVAFEKG